MLTTEQLKEIQTSKFQTFTSLEYLKIDIANNLGFDKLSYKERISKVDSIISQNALKTLSNAQLKELVLSLKPEETTLTYAGLLAYRDYLHNIPSGYCISLDSVCSGAQILSTITSDIQGMYYTGVLGNTRNDLYMEVAKNYVSISKDALNLQAKDFRPKIKEAVMTNLYGSVDRPRKLLGEDNLPYFYKAMQATMPNAYLLKNILVKEWNSTVDVQKWFTPDCHIAYCPVITTKKKEMIINTVPMEFTYKEQGTSDYQLSNGANAVHSIDAYIMREMTRRAMWDKEHIKKTLQLLTQKTNKKEKPNKQLNNLIQSYNLTKVVTLAIIEHLNEYTVNSLSIEHREALTQLLIRLLKQPRFELIAVHDCFKCLPKYGNYLRYQYNEILANLAVSNIANFLLLQLSPNKYQLPQNQEMKNSLYSLILNSNYGIC